MRHWQLLLVHRRIPIAVCAHTLAPRNRAQQPWRPKIAPRTARAHAQRAVWRAQVPRGHDLDLSLAVAGMFLYAAYFLAGILWDFIPFRPALFLAVATTGGAFSTYLVYVLKFILGDFCIVCFGFHCVNYTMLLLAIFEAREHGLAKLKAS